MKSISIVIPAYNEEANVARTVKKVSKTAHSLGIDHEIILVNDGSTDRTGDFARSLLLCIPHFWLEEHIPNRGYGGALKAGFASAAREWVAFIPADGQFDFAELKLLMERMDEADIICGYRKDRQDNFIRKLNGWGWNTLVRLLFGRLSWDIDCGFKLFRREILSHVILESDGVMVDTEFLAGAKARGYRIAEVSVTHLPRKAGDATGADLKVILTAFRDLILFHLRLSRELRQMRQVWSQKAELVS